jgi:hypothetical protein
MSPKTLDSPADWDDWFFVIKSKATATNIWKYIDPDNVTPTVIPELTDPPEADFSALTIKDIEAFKFQYQVWKDQNTATGRVTNAISELHQFIVTNISTRNIVYIRDCITVHNMLVVLKKHLAPTDRARELEVIRRYNNLRHYNKNQEIFKYLDEWDKTYHDAVKLNLPEVSGTRATYDFLAAITTIDSSYVVAQEIYIAKNTVPDFVDLLEEFRNHMRLYSFDRTALSHTAFVAALRGEKADGTPIRQPECVCGQYHRWIKCYYLNKTIRPEGWKPDREVRKRIDDLIAKDTDLKRQIKEKVGLEWQNEGPQILGTY